MNRRPLLALSVLASVCLMGCPGAHGVSDGDAGGDSAMGPHDAGIDGWGEGSKDANVDTGPLVDGGAHVATCDPMDAHADVCADACFGVTSAFWDGTSCVAAHCDCAGTECDVYATVEACQAEHASCDAALCTSTGGAWFDRPEWCGHFTCGFPNPDDCETPTPACDCGAYRNFVPGSGCMDGPLCELTAPMEPDARCASTGGTWRTDICGSATCGRLSDLDCVAPGCVCGELEIFDTDRGCIRSPTCEVRELGESCTETGLCGGGSVCCVSGGASTAARCEAPRCDDPSGVCGPPRP
jgi:hypothetical protein